LNYLAFHHNEEFDLMINN